MPLCKVYETWTHNNRNTFFDFSIEKTKDTSFRTLRASYQFSFARSREKICGVHFAGQVIQSAGLPKCFEINYFEGKHKIPELRNRIGPIYKPCLCNEDARIP